MFKHLKFWFYKTDKRSEFKITYKLPTIAEIKEFLRHKIATQSTTARNDE